MIQSNWRFELNQSNTWRNYCTVYDLLKHIEFLWIFSNARFSTTEHFHSLFDRNSTQCKEIKLNLHFVHSLLWYGLKIRRCDWWKWQDEMEIWYQDIFCDSWCFSTNNIGLYKHRNQRKSSKLYFLDSHNCKLSEKV